MCSIPTLRTFILNSFSQYLLIFVAACYCSFSVFLYVNYHCVFLYFEYSNIFLISALRCYIWVLHIRLLCANNNFLLTYLLTYLALARQQNAEFMEGGKIEVLLLTICRPKAQEILGVCRGHIGISSSSWINYPTVYCVSFGRYLWLSPKVADKPSTNLCSFWAAIFGEAQPIFWIRYCKSRSLRNIFTFIHRKHGRQWNPVRDKDCLSSVWWTLRIADENKREKGKLESRKSGFLHALPLDPAN